MKKLKNKENLSPKLSVVKSTTDKVEMVALTFIGVLVPLLIGVAGYLLGVLIHLTLLLWFS